MNARLRRAAIAVAVVLLLSQRTASAEFRVRGLFNWGASMEEVLAKEDAVLIGTSENLLTYMDTFLGREEEVVYVFLDKKGLVSVSHAFRPNYDPTMADLYFNDYENMKRSISAFYGPPDIDQMYWSDDRHMYDSDKLGEALLQGHVTCLAMWYLPADSTIMSLMLMKESTAVTIAHTFYWTEFFTEALEAMKEQAGDF